LTPTVMVIDDNQEIVNLLSILLKIHGYKSISAPNVPTALDYLKRGTLPSLILTDYAMPVLNGCDLIEYLSRQSQFKAIPVFIITGSAIEDLRLPSTINFKGVIHKPFKLNTILKIVKSYALSANYSSVICENT